MRFWPFGKREEAAIPEPPIDAPVHDPYEGEPYGPELRLVDAWLAARPPLVYGHHMEVLQAVRDSGPAGDDLSARQDAAWAEEMARQWKIPEARAFLGLEGAARGRVAIACLQRVASLRYPEPKTEVVDYDRFAALGEAASRLLRPAGAIDPAALLDLVRAWGAGRVEEGFGPLRIVGLLETFVAEGGLTPELRAVGEAFAVDLRRRVEAWGTADARRAESRLLALLDPDGPPVVRGPEPWQRPFDAEEFTPLVAHARAAKGMKRTAAWTREATRLLASGLDPLDAFEAAVAALGEMSEAVDALQSDELRGLVWAVGLIGDERADALLGRALRATAHKIPGFGARSQKGFTAAIAALESRDGFPALAALSQGAHRVAAPNLADLLRAALGRSAARQGIAPEEIEELVVPTYGLTLGRRTEAFGDAVAEIEVVGAEVETRWSRDRKPLKSVPVSVKEGHAERLKELRRETKEIGESLAAQRARLEGLLLSERRLPYALWRERYLDHPLLAPMARRLIWRFETGDETRTGIAEGDRIVDAEGRALEGIGEAAVSLWHPLGAGLATIETWRGALVDREIAQPFKQAFREIYLLTDAELATVDYSNRFAAQILRQHQFAALARARGWRYALMGYFDAYDVPTRRYERWGLTAEFRVEVPYWDAAGGNDAASESGIALYLTTDDVRFVREGPAGRDGYREREAVPLAEVPPLLFSEAMRDVDLFVGVASVANDPMWIDQAHRHRIGDAWGSLAFGALRASAETRRDALARVLPRLAIAPVARIEGRFLVVRGRLRTYRIHLGSSNILMAPNDQYLCIVPASGRKPGAVNLPFEGDGTLAAILGKALLLARDHEITDETILRQIRGQVPLATIRDFEAVPREELGEA